MSNENKSGYYPLCNLEQSQILRDVGFDWETRDFWLLPAMQNEWIGKSGFDPYNHNRKRLVDEISRPTVDLALRWCREVMGWNSTVSFVDSPERPL